MSKKFNVLLMIETSGPGGAETVLFNIAKNLDRARYNPRVVLFKPGWFKGLLEENGIVTEIIHSRRAWDISFLYRLLGYCRRNKIELIHGHLPGANLYGSLAGALMGIPVIATLHNEFLIPGSTERHNWIKHFLIRRLTNKLVVVADFMQSDYIKKGKFPRAKLTTIYNGIHMGDPTGLRDPDRLRQELNLKKDDLVVGNVANLRPPKGQKYLIEAAAIICQRLPQAKFLLIGQGGGHLKEEAERQIANLQLQENVKLLGFREDVPELLRLFDIFVLPSTSEGLPMSIVEAMAAAKPVVATRVGGLPEIVTDGDNGYLVEPANVAALAEKLQILLQSKELRTCLGQRGRQIASEKFSLETMIKQYQELYEKVLNR